jgi:amidase
VAIPATVRIVTEIHDLTVAELAAAIRRRELSPVQITAHYLDRMDRLNATVGAFFTITAELATEQAAEAEKAVVRAEDPTALPPLTGVPIPIKDLNMVAGVRQTLGSAVYADNVPEMDDYVYVALRAAGSVLTGKTATPEFGLPCYTETEVGPPARTPWDLNRSAGGSSGGAAAAVAAGLAPAAQGSDGGGSIRIPASVCGLFGIKPTRGRISGAPLVPDLFGLGTDGPIARTVADAALLLDVMTGNQPGDMYTLPPLPAGETFLGYASRPPGRLRIGRTMRHPIGDGTVHPDCAAAYQDASELLASLGHEVVELDSPFGPDLVPPFEVLWYAHATLAPVGPDQEQQLRPFTQYMRERGRQVNAEQLIQAQGYLQFMVRAALGVLNGFDAVLTPTVAAPPVPVGYFEEVAPAENFERQKRFAPFAATFNVSGQPAVNVPLYWNPAGLPIGVMLAGRMGAEGTLISLSAQLESARPWKDRHPPLW